MRDRAALAAARKARGYTQAELRGVLEGRHVVISQQGYSQWERGIATPNPVQQLVLAQILGVQRDELFPDDWTPHNDNSKREVCDHGVSYDDPCVRCEDAQDARARRGQ